MIDIKTRARHPESNGIVERFAYLQVEQIVGKLMQQYNEERLHAALGYMAPATWHRGRPDVVREERARRIAAARAQRKHINQQRFAPATLSGESLPS